jgi:hypothetical protein
MSRIILRSTRKWPSAKGGCPLRRDFQLVFTSKHHLSSRIKALHLPQLFSFDSDCTYSTASAIIARWERSRLQVSNIRARTRVGPAPASLSTTFARACLVCQAWPALDLTTKPLLLHLPPTTSTLVLHLDSPSPPPFPCTLELEYLPFPSVTTVAALQGFVSLSCTTQHHRCRYA